MWYFAAVLLLLLIMSLAAGYFMFMTVFDTSRKGGGEPDPDFIDSEGDAMRPTARKLYDFVGPLKEEFKKLPLKELTVTSFDGLKLKGYLLEGDPGEVVICVHGYRSSMENDFSDKVKIYRDRGSTVLFVNDRAHGNSEGRYLGFSELDRFDVAKWVDLINSMYVNPRIYLHGVSMGGATVIHCADMGLKNVKGIIDDCGFDSIIGITKAQIKNMFHIPYFPIGYCAWFWSKLIAKVSFTASIGEECVKKTDLPILFIHGREDHYVPCYMSEKMYEACVSPKELHIAEGCGHGAAYMMITDEYTDAVNRMLDGRIR